LGTRRDLLQKGVERHAKPNGGGRKKWSILFDVGAIKSGVDTRSKAENEVGSCIGDAGLRRNGGELTQPHLGGVQTTHNRGGNIHKGE